jgi:hypothetical protein
MAVAWCYCHVLRLSNALWYVDYFTNGQDALNCNGFDADFVRGFRTNECITSNTGTSLFAECDRESMTRLLTFYSDSSCQVFHQVVSTSIASGCASMFCTADLETAVPADHAMYSITE